MLEPFIVGAFEEEGLSLCTIVGKTDIEGNEVGTSLGDFLGCGEGCLVGFLLGFLVGCVNM